MTWLPVKRPVANTSITVSGKPRPQPTTRPPPLEEPPPNRNDGNGGGLPCRGCQPFAKARCVSVFYSCRGLRGGAGSNTGTGLIRKRSDVEHQKTDDRLAGGTHGEPGPPGAAGPGGVGAGGRGGFRPARA